MKLAEPAQSVLPKLWGLAALNSVEHPASQLELLQNILAPQRVRMCNARYGHAMAPSTRQQHGSVGRENMPITGLPWQQIMLVTKICRMGNRWQEHVGMMSGSPHKTTSLLTPALEWWLMRGIVPKWPNYAGNTVLSELLQFD